jgi:hypothetical protein
MDEWDRQPNPTSPTNPNPAAANSSAATNSVWNTLSKYADPAAKLGSTLLQNQGAISRKPTSITR